MFISERRINKTKKLHQCIGCFKKFPAGSWLWYWVGLYEGEFCANYYCNPCMTEVENHCRDYEDGFSEGDLREGRFQRVRDWQWKRNKAKEA